MAEISPEPIPSSTKKWIWAGSVGLFLIASFAGAYAFLMWQQSAFNITIISSEKTTVPLNIGQLKGEESPYSKNTNHVYYLDEVIDGADPTTFHVFDYVRWAYPDEPNIYAKDTNNIYRDGQQLIGADPDTFHFLRFANQAGCVEHEEHYFNVCELTGYAVDKNAVYNVYTGARLTGIDPATFKVLNRRYARDKNNIYYFYTLLDWFPIDAARTLSIENVDLASFKIVSGQTGYDAQDKNHKYLRGQVVATADAQLGVVSAANYRLTQTNDGIAIAYADLTADIAPFSSQKVSFSVEAVIGLDDLKDYTFGFENKGTYGVIHTYGVKNNLLYVSDIGTSSIEDAIYKLQFAISPDLDQAEFKTICKLKPHVQPDGSDRQTWYWLEDVNNAHESYLKEKYGDVPYVAFYCLGDYLVLGNLLIADYKIPMDATELKPDKTSIHLVE